MQLIKEKTEAQELSYLAKVTKSECGRPETQVQAPESKSQSSINSGILICKPQRNSFTINFSIPLINIYAVIIQGYQYFEDEI